MNLDTNLTCEEKNDIHVVWYYGVSAHFSQTHRQPACLPGAIINSYHWLLFCVLFHRPPGVPSTWGPPSAMGLAGGDWPNLDCWHCIICPWLESGGAKAEWIGTMKLCHAALSGKFSQKLLDWEPALWKDVLFRLIDELKNRTWCHTKILFSSVIDGYKKPRTRWQMYISFYL